MTPSLVLSPSQRASVDRIAALRGRHRLFAVWCRSGLGRTTMLRALHSEWSGAFLSARGFLDRLSEAHPLAMEEALHEAVRGAFQDHPVVFLDDLQLVTSIVRGCRSYPRSGLLESVFADWKELVSEADRCLVVGTAYADSDQLRRWAHWTGFGDFDVSDYRALFAGCLEGKSQGLDFEKLIRFFPSLDVHQIRRAASAFSGRASVETRELLEWLRDHVGGSNVDTAKVEAVELRDLHGVDSVIESLEANLVLPIIDDELATRLALRPKRGVLLYGPPGTGKTTVGRALARRLGSKFFLLDGNVIAGIQDFYRQVVGIFEAAKVNRPSVIFVDDSDVIFEAGEEMGLYRFLLSHLDGLESEGIHDVCLVLTAMRVSQLPPALIRSGRVELWLEMRLPDSEARARILADRLERDFPSELERPDLENLVPATEGLTGADLRRLTVDARHLLGFDIANARPAQSMDRYFERALQTVRENKSRLEEALAERSESSMGSKRLGPALAGGAFLRAGRGRPARSRRRTESPPGAGGP